jgi:thioredoxin
MSVKDNPFAASQGDYATEISFGAPNAGAGPAGDLIRDTTTAEFTKDVIQESRNQPVLVDFWAPWCGPCKQLTPVLEKAVRAAGGTVKLVKMNIDDHPAIAGQLGVQSIPAVIAFRDGQPVDGFMGAVPESQVQDFIQRLGGDPKQSGLEAALEQAAAAIQAGDDDLAAQIYSAVLAEEAGHPAAIAGLPASLRVVAMTALMRSLMGEAVAIGDTQAVRGRDALLLDLILHEIPRLEELPLGLPFPSDPRLAALCRRYLDAPTPAVTIDDWARRAGMSRRSFTRRFQRETGLSLSVWRQQASLFAALPRLSEGEAVTTVALDLGYESVAAFTTMFKRMLGTSPRAYLTANAPAVS